MFRFLLLFVCFTSPLMTSCSQSVKVDLAAAQTGQKKSLNKPLIVIDAGHGGFDIGAKVQSVEEKALALQTATLVKQYLHDMGYRVILTRSRDVFVSLKKRTQVANDTKSKIFLSIHFNAFKGTNVKGLEIYYYNKGAKWRQNASRKLAQTVLNGMLAATKSVSRGVKTGNFHVIRETNMPAILIEGGFITNEQERTRLKDKKYVEKMAHSIAQGVDTYFHS